MTEKCQIVWMGARRSDACGCAGLTDWPPRPGPRAQQAGAHTRSSPVVAVMRRGRSIGMFLLRSPSTRALRLRVRPLGSFAAAGRRTFPSLRMVGSAGDGSHRDRSAPHLRDQDAVPAGASHERGRAFGRRHVPLRARTERQSLQPRSRRPSLTPVGTNRQSATSPWYT
jgi:hypothetical protein